MPSHAVNPVFRSLTRPLLLLGVDRCVFGFLLMITFAYFNLFNAFLSAVVLFVALWTGARLAQRSDPQFLRILLGSGRWRFRYDSAKWSPTLKRGGAGRGSAQRFI